MSKKFEGTCILIYLVVGGYFYITAGYWTAILWPYILLAKLT